MKVLILKNCFRPECKDSKRLAHIILKKGEEHELDAECAKKLIDAGQAQATELPKKKEEPKEEPKEEAAE